MQHEPIDIAYRWFDQAMADLEAGRRNTREGTAYLGCFLAQQSTEKALKALVYWVSGDIPRVHAISALLKLMPSEARLSVDLASDALTLDKYYTTTRYPDTLDYALPADSFNRREAEGALAIASLVLDHCASLLPKRDDPS